MLIKRFFFIYIILIYSCSSGDPSNQKMDEVYIDSFESALPHGKMLEVGELSDVDKIKLAKANGIEAKILPVDSIIQQIDSDTSGLIIYNFWNMDCSACKSTIDILKKLRQETFQVENIEVVHINTISLYPEMINSFIREYDIVEKVYTIPTDTIPMWPNRFQNDWDGQLPAILIVNNLDGTRLFYQKEFSQEEIETVLLPLTL